MITIDRESLPIGLPIKYQVRCPVCGDTITVKGNISSWRHSIIMPCPCGQDIGVTVDMKMTLTVYTAQNIHTPKPDPLEVAYAQIDERDAAEAEE